MRGDNNSLLSRTKRRWAWIGLLALALHAPFVAYQLPDDTWMLSITVALLVAMVILVDDHQRYRRRPAATVEAVRQPASDGEQ